MSIYGSLALNKQSYAFNNKRTYRGMRDPTKEEAELLVFFKSKLKEEMECKNVIINKFEKSRNELMYEEKEHILEQDNEIDPMDKSESIVDPDDIDKQIPQNTTEIQERTTLHVENEEQPLNTISNNIDTMIYKELKRNYDKCIRNHSLKNMRSSKNLDNFMKGLEEDEFLQRRKRRSGLNDEQKRNSHSVCEQRRKVAMNSAILALSDFFETKECLNKKRTIFMAINVIMKLHDENFNLKKRLTGKKDREEK